jgi:2-oxoisovalerate dehydrogenase E1 component beta subunit
MLAALSSASRLGNCWSLFHAARQLQELPGHLRTISTGIPMLLDRQSDEPQEHQLATKPMNFCSAINDALHISLATDPRTIVFGEDVAFGGVFRCTVGLLERFGRQRVFNTPLSEQGIGGFAIGAAAEGLVPLAEIQFADYIFPAFDQLVNEAAKYRYRSGGKYDVGGLTVRAPYGAVGHGGHYHSQSPEAFFTHVPGLKVVMPSGPREAKGLLLAAARDPNPVVFFEAKMLYRTAVEEVPVDDYEVSLGQARIVRPGNDITVVAWGQQVLVADLAARQVAQKHGISAEVIDLRTLMPWDVPTVESSVNKTGRLVVTHEAPITSGFGAEVVSEMTNRCFWRLQSPPKRVCGYDIPFPLVYEPLYLPTVQRVAAAIEAAMKDS